MIKIEKKNAVIPLSLQPALADLFPRVDIPQPCRTTHDRRMQVIDEGGYIYKDKFNSRYKTKDIRQALIELYKGKCAFCEGKVEQHHIEHYRPKNTYYWLAYSWDNLIMSCPNCNINKGVHFEIAGESIVFDKDRFDYHSINNISSTSYDGIELPKMVNPEITDPLNHISFSRTGFIMSNESRFKYTIEKCKIDRKYLNDERRKLLDVFERDIQSALIEHQEIEHQTFEISAIIRKFIRDSKDNEMSFLAFRRYAIESGFLSEIIKGIC